MKRRFIAGARCSQCRLEDRTVLITTTDDEWIECVACGYTARRPTVQQGVAVEQPIDRLHVTVTHLK